MFLSTFTNLKMAASAIMDSHETSVVNVSIGSIECDLSVSNLVAIAQAISDL